MFGGRENFSNLVEEVMPLTGAECRPDVSHIKREVEESWADLGINATVSGAGRPLPKIPIPISQETIEAIRAAAAAPENPKERAVVSTRARASQTVTVATKSQATLAKETPKKLRSASCQTSTPKTDRERSIAIQTDAAADEDRDTEESEQTPEINECSCQKKSEVVEVLANRGNEYYVVYKDREEPVWENESSIDEALIQTFKERTNPHFVKGGADFSVSASDNHEGPSPEGSAAVDRDGDIPKSSRSAATNVPVSNKSQSRRKSGAPTKVTKEETLSEKRTRRRKPEKPSKVSEATDEERTTVITPKKILNEEGEYEKDNKRRETPSNVGDEDPEENALRPDNLVDEPQNEVAKNTVTRPHNIVEEPQNEVDKNTVTRKRSKTSTANSSMDATVSPRSRRKSSAQALTKFKKWGVAEDNEEEEDDDDDGRVRKTERGGTTSTTDVDKVVSEFQAELDLDISQVDDSGMLASHRGHCDPEYLAREQTKREREEARKSRLINKKLNLTEEEEKSAKMGTEEAQVAGNDTEEEPGPHSSPRRSQRATAGKKLNLTTGDTSDITFERENQNQNQDQDQNQVEEEAKTEKDGSGNVQDGVIILGGQGQPTTLVQAANQQLGVVPKRKRGRPPKNRDAHGNPIPAKTPKLISPKKKRGRPKVCFYQ